jgi:hypothetical protein
MFKPDLLCLQETKLASLNLRTIRSCLGRDYEVGYAVLPAEETRGGILLAVNNSSMRMSSPSLTNHTLSAQVLDIRKNQTWMVTAVYGPQGDLEKRLFLSELRAIKQSAGPLWLVMGDFNLIYRDQDKNNDRVNRRLMHSFSRALNHMDVKEIQLTGRKYTWSSNQNNPTLTHIGMALCTPGWEDVYAQPHIPPLSLPKFTPKFRFESYWTSMPGFMERVMEAWSATIPSQCNSLATLHLKLSRTAKALKAWSKTVIPQGKLTMAICREVVDQLETAQEDRHLTVDETNLIKHLKVRFLGLAAIEKSRAKQKLRLTWLRKGDVNTKYFQLMANIRKQRNFIHPLHLGNSVVFGHQEKQDVVYQHYLQHIGTHVPRECLLNFPELHWQPQELSHLELPFSKDEVKKVILEAPKEKVPGLDGFIGLFFSKCWSKIKGDIMAALHQFYFLN